MPAASARRGAATPAARASSRRDCSALRDAAKEAKLGYWAEQIDIQAAVVGGARPVRRGQVGGVHRRRCEGRATREDATEKHAVTPGPDPARARAPGRYAARSEKADEALREYEAVLVKEPNRYRTIAGAWRPRSGRATRQGEALCR